MMKINVCSKHEQKIPLISTYKFPQSEQWCPFCGAIYGAFADVLSADIETAIITDWIDKTKPYLTGKTDEYIYDYQNLGITDIETGGFSIEKNGVCEISVLAVDPDLNIIDKFHCYIRPYFRPDASEGLVSYKEDSMTVNGISIDTLNAKGLPVDIAMKLLHEFFILHNIRSIVAHNGKSFDKKRIDHLYDRFGYGKTLVHVGCIDTLPISREKLKHLPSHKMEDLCAHYEIVNENPHRAEGDSLALLQLYKILKSI